MHVFEVLCRSTKITFCRHCQISRSYRMLMSVLADSCSYCDNSYNIATVSCSPYPPRRFFVRNLAPPIHFYCKNQVNAIDSWLAYVHRNVVCISVSDQTTCCCCRHCWYIGLLDVFLPCVISHVRYEDDGLVRCCADQNPATAGAPFILPPGPTNL